MSSPSTNVTKMYVMRYIIVVSILPMPITQGDIATECDKLVRWYHYGNPNGVPVLFLHGGPGSGFSQTYAEIIQPLFNRISFITFDQRGSGASRGFDFPKHNNTALLIGDIENLREHLGIEQWTVSGISWGTTLALLYARKYPHRCTKLLLASLFLARREDQIWSFEKSRKFLDDIFSDTEKKLGTKLTGCQRFRRNFLKGLHSKDANTRLKFAHAFLNLSRYMARLTPIPIDPATITEDNVNQSRILLSYADKDFFLPPKTAALQKIKHLRNIPITLMHGRFDLTCCVEQAFLLKSLLPQTDLRIVAGSHSVQEEPMMSEFRRLFEDCV